MADRGTKIALASAVMVCAVGGSAMFLRSGKPVDPEFIASDDLELPLRRVELPRVDQLQTTSHLLGVIETVGEAGATQRPLPTKAIPAITREQVQVGELPPPKSWQAEAPDASSFAADGVVVHRVREGETLSSIARRYLGSSDRYAELFAANRQILADPNQLKVGMQLVIPPTAAAADARPAASPLGGGLVPITPGSWQRGKTIAASPRHYRVRADETLVDVAKQFYGDGTRFLEIYEANRDVLASPDQLHEGLMLVIP